MSESEVYFSLPGTSIRGIPVINSVGDRLNLGIVEVGCRPKRKSRQIRLKKEFLTEVWNGNLELRDLSWRPQFYRILPHFRQDSSLGLYKGDIKVIDLVLIYNEITETMLEKLNEDDIRRIFQDRDNFKGIQVRKKWPDEKIKKKLERIIELRDAQQLWYLIQNPPNRNYNQLRGSMTEALALKDIEINLPSGVNLFSRQQIAYISQKYRNGTEIDGILTSYGQKGFFELIDRLKRLAHLECRTPINTPL